jgi:dienelactone hydrolase
MFMVSILYPAGPAPAPLPEPWLEPIWVATPPRGILFDKEFLLVIRPPEVATGLVSHAFPAMPVAGRANPFPVLLYSHGGQYFRKDNLHKLTELASHGFVVVSPDYYDAWFSVLPDGTPAVYDPVNDYPHTNLGQGLHDFSVVDARFVLDELERLNASDPRFQGRLDLTRIGAFGWSFGGATAADLCRIDSRVKAAVLYDAAFWAAPDTTKQGLSKPFLCVNSEHPPSPDWATPAINLVNRASANALFLVVAGSEHADFTDLILVDDPTPAMHAMSHRVTEYTRAFFSRHLLGAAEPLLDAPPGDGSVLNWIRK